jgi:hypothetical protein
MTKRVLGVAVPRFWSNHSSVKCQVLKSFGSPAPPGEKYWLAHQS